MKNSPFRWIGCSIAMTVFLLVACDPFKEDTLPLPVVNISARDYYVLPGTSAVIDLKTFVESTFTIVSVKISENPKQGVLSELGEFLVNYEPLTSFKQGQDQFIVTIYGDNNKILKVETITVHLIQDAIDLPCSMIAVEDVAHATINNPIMVKFLNNDNVCGVDADKIKTSIEIEPKHGKAMLLGDSIQYFPEPGYTGVDMIVYKVFEQGDSQPPSSDQQFSFGVIEILIQDNRITSTGNWTILQTAWYPSKLYFITDQVGFSLGEFNYLLKTIDGGISWRNVSVETDEGIYWWYRDVYFLNSSTGYATATKHGEGFKLLDEYAIFKTTDGGETWVRMPFMDGKIMTGGIYFASSSTGLVTSHDKIFKTFDGGENWKLVYDGAGELNNLTFSFLNATIGFLLNNGNLLKTDDGGDTWYKVNEITSVRSMAISDKHVYALSEEVGPDSIPNFHVWSLREGTDWESVLSESQMPAGTISFSPSGNFGIVASYYTRDDNRRTVSVWITRDGGITWINQKLNSSEYPYWSAVPMAISISSEKSAFMLVHDDLGWQALLKYTTDQN